MSIKISYSKKKDANSSTNLVLFCNDKFSINSLRKYLLNLGLCKTENIQSLYRRKHTKAVYETSLGF